MPRTYKIKVCAICGKAEGSNWSHHWKRQHPSHQPQELVPGEAPTDPIDDNWVYLIKDAKVRQRYETALVSQPPLAPSPALSQVPLVAD